MAEFKSSTFHNFEFRGSDFSSGSSTGAPAVCPNCQCSDASKLLSVPLDEGELVIQICCACSAAFGHDDTFEWNAVRQSLADQGVIAIAVTCTNCGNNALDGFSPVEVSLSPESLADPPIYRCHECEELFKISWNFGLNRGEIASSSVSNSNKRDSEHGPTFTQSSAAASDEMRSDKAKQLIHRHDPTKLTEADSDNYHLLAEFDLTKDLCTMKSDCFEDMRARSDHSQCYIQCENCDNNEGDLFDVNIDYNSGMKQIYILCQICQKQLVVTEQMIGKAGISITANADYDPDTSFCLKCENCPNDNSDLFDRDLLAEGVVFCLQCEFTEVAARVLPIYENFSRPLLRRSLDRLHRKVVDDVNLLSPGDHVAWQRLPIPFYHHAIIEGVDRQAETCTVIENTFGKGITQNVRRTTVKLEAHYKSMYRIDYEPDECLAVEKTLSLARSRLGERKYHALTYNCEHFATWCKTGVDVCGQKWTLLNRAARVTGSSALQAVERVVPIVVKASLKKAPVGQAFALVGESVVDQAAVAGTSAAKLLRNVKVGAMTLNIGLNVAAEAAFFSYYVYKAYVQWKNAKITFEDFRRECWKLGGESFFAVGLGIVGSILGGLTPCPIVGAIVLGTLGNLAGRLLGTVICKLISECRARWKGAGIESDSALQLAITYMRDLEVVEPQHEACASGSWSCDESELCYIECSGCSNHIGELFREKFSGVVQCLVCLKYLCIPKELDVTQNQMTFWITPLERRNTSDELRNTPISRNRSLDDVGSESPENEGLRETSTESSKASTSELSEVRTDDSSNEPPCYIECSKCNNNVAERFIEKFENDTHYLHCLNCSAVLHIPTFSPSYRD